jgi:hypothetical protein
MENTRESVVRMTGRTQEAYMMKQSVGVLLPNQSLLNEHEAHKAIKAAAHTMRFERYTFINDTNNYRANLVVFHGLSTLDRNQCDLSEDYRDDTGVIMCGADIMPRDVQETIIPEDIRCAATTVKAFVDLVHIPTGHKRIIELPIWEIPNDQDAGTFWRSVGHKVAEVNHLTIPKPFEDLVFSVVDPQMLSLIKI